MVADRMPTWLADLHLHYAIHHVFGHRCLPTGGGVHDSFVQVHLGGGMAVHRVAKLQAITGLQVLGGRELEARIEGSCGEKVNAVLQPWAIVAQLLGGVVVGKVVTAEEVRLRSGKTVHFACRLSFEAV